MPAVTAGILEFTVRAAELTKEALHGRALLVGVVLVAGVSGLVLHRDLDRDHRRLHPLHHIGKAKGLLGGARCGVSSLGMGRAAEDINAIRRSTEAIYCEPGHDRCHQCHFSCREEGALPLPMRNKVTLVHYKISRMMIKRKAARRCRCGFPHYTMLAWELMFGNELPKSAVRRRRVFAHRCLLPSLRAKRSNPFSPNKERMDGFVAHAPLRKRFALVAGNDADESRRRNPSDWRVVTSDASEWVMRQYRNSRLRS